MPTRKARRRAPSTASRLDSTPLATFQTFFVSTFLFSRPWSHTFRRNWKTRTFRYIPPIHLRTLSSPLILSSFDMSLDVYLTICNALGIALRACYILAFLSRLHTPLTRNNVLYMRRPDWTFLLVFRTMGHDCFGSAVHRWRRSFWCMRDVWLPLF